MFVGGLFDAREEIWSGRSLMMGKEGRRRILVVMVAVFEGIVLGLGFFARNRAWGRMVERRCLLLMYRSASSSAGYLMRHLQRLLSAWWTRMVFLGLPARGQRISRFNHGNILFTHEGHGDDQWLYG
jgi:hypothetical protein